MTLDVALVISQSLVLCVQALIVFGWALKPSRNPEVAQVGDVTPLQWTMKTATGGFRFAERLMRRSLG
jgi:hypothetical protein